MNMFARFNENPAMPLQDIKETKCYGRTHARTYARTDNVKTVYPTTNKVCRGYNKDNALNLLVCDKDFAVQIIATHKDNAVYLLFCSPYHFKLQLRLMLYTYSDKDNTQQL